uniref:Uncharacterized protein n=1 Tax=Yersinia pestis Java 9 TaxID=880632 RepID=E8PSE6_YERPE|nr:hypothetical protein YPJ_pJARS3622 [Yersinia pestis Java 9]
MDHNSIYYWSGGYFLWMCFVNFKSVYLYGFFLSKQKKWKRKLIF